MITFNFVVKLARILSKLLRYSMRKVGTVF